MCLNEKLRKRYILRRLREKHGEKFVKRIKALETDLSLTGADIAREFGITRERVRQICDELYGKGLLRKRKQKKQG